MDRPRVAIAHDYLCQRGGAERVVLAMLDAFPDAVVHTLFHDPENTYPEFRHARVVTSPLNRVPALRHNPRLALPLLTQAADRVRVDADVAIVSTSGWAHGFDITGHRIVYCHNPPRWVHQSEEYLGAPPWRTPVGLALLAMRPHLRHWDRRAAQRADQYLANSTVVQQRVRAAYGVEARLVPPPHGARPDLPDEPVPALADWEDGYLLVVSRLLPYKHVDVAVEAVRGTRHRLVVVGRGPEEGRLRAHLPGNVRMMSGLSDAELRWVYAHARLLVAPSHEDFGLTPLEAAAFGKPTVALRAGGYLDTMVEGVTAVFFERPDAGDLRSAIETAVARSWDGTALRECAAGFSRQSFGGFLTDLVSQAGQRT